MLTFGRRGPPTKLCEAHEQQYTGQASCCAHKKCHKPCTGATVRPFDYRGKSSFKGSDSVEKLNFRQNPDPRMTIFSSAKIVILRCRMGMTILKSTYR